MEKNYWQIDENLYKVHITSDVYENLKDDFKIELLYRVMIQMES